MKHMPVSLKFLGAAVVLREPKVGKTRDTRTVVSPDHYCPHASTDVQAKPREQKYHSICTGEPTSIHAYAARQPDDSEERPENPLLR